ncbi:hypothetical protein [Shewanella algae]|uniref:hypothetical protein n=1 Tax=Shewanella algae TaxID=38313 RepID=UPI0030052F3F
MLKVKLYQLKKPITRTLIYENFKSKKYTDELGFGFDIVEDSDNCLIFQFVERIVNLIKIESVDGDISEIESVSYMRVKFGIRLNSRNALYVINPPRSMKYPFEMIRSLFGQEYQLIPVELNLKSLLEIFSENYNCIVRSISLSNIQYDVNTVAKTKIASTKDLSEFYINNYSETPAILDTLLIIADGIETELSRTGRLRIHESNLFSFMLMLDHSLS